MNNNLIIFVKYPEPGFVKTRIGKKIGFEKAADLYSSLTLHIFDNLIKTGDFDISVFYTPDDKEDKIRELLDTEDINYFPQKGKTLGDKISNAFEISFSNGFNNCVVIGSDCIELNSDSVTTAFNHLNNGSECVIGPTEDGGYYLIGLKSCNFPSVFEGIAWSTGKVFEETITKISLLNLKHIVLEKLNDVDDINDINSNVIDVVRNYYPNFEV